MITNKEAAEELRKAADRLDKGWIQGKRWNEQGACMLGALDRAEVANIFDLWIRDHELIDGTDFTELGLLRPIAYVNDLPGQTKEYCQNLMRKCAEDLEADRGR